MYWLKSCPRCGGDLFDDRDHFGYYIACAQCGLQRDMVVRPTQGAVPANLASRRRPEAFFVPSMRAADGRATVRA